MPAVPQLNGKTVAVMGLGKSGTSAARAIAASGATVIAWDDNAAARQSAAAEGVTIRDLMAEDFAAIDLLLWSPGIPHTHPQPHPVASRARATKVPVVCDVELLAIACPKARFVGITGTNGKSTTTALLAHMLSAVGRTALAGANLGPPALSMPLLPKDGIYVLEMSSYRLERLAALRFDVAAMLNLSKDHLDRHGDMVGYAAAKRHVFDRQSREDLAVIGVDDAGSRDMAGQLCDGPAPLVTVSGQSPADIWCESGMLRDAAGRIVAMAEAPALPGAHNAQNAAAAAAMALQLGLSRTEIAAGIVSYPGLPHRQQHVGSVDGVVFVNDSKATNADAAERALQCYDRLVWIAGGMAKAGGIEPLVPLFPRVARALLIGRDAPLLAATLAAHGVAHEIVGTLEAAVPAAFAAARGLDAPVVLLSPACASWDQFTGYDQRGDRFAALVSALAGGTA